MAERNSNTLNNGFRRILYDSMILSQSLRAIIECEGFPRPAPGQIMGDVEAQHMNALIQMRSLNDFLIDRDHNREDTMVISNFPGCTAQPSRLPEREDAHGRFAHTYVAHKSWDAVTKDEAAGAAQMGKPDVIRIGMELLGGFEDFWARCRSNGIGNEFQSYAAAYERIYRQNKDYLDSTTRLTGDAVLRAYVNPLNIAWLEEQLPENVSHEPGDVALALLGDMIADRSTSLECLRKRYGEVSALADQPQIVPGHPSLMNHVIRPLVEAKQCYVLAMPVACIAQAGLVGEMVALWRFRMVEPKIDKRALDTTVQKLVFGREFDKLGQDQRVKVLQVVDNVEQEVVDAFTQLRSIRRRYMHFMMEEETDKDADARQALKYANQLVIKTLNASYRDGRLVLPPKVMRYIRDIILPPERPKAEDQEATHQ